MRGLAMLAALVLLAACDFGTSPEESIAGTYTLDSMDGHLIPARIVWLDRYEHENVTIVHGGALHLYADGTYRDSTHTTSEDGDSRLHLVVPGSYTLSGSSLILEPRWGTQACDGRISRGVYVCGSSRGEMRYVQQ